jgi:hypothetical protein
MEGITMAPTTAMIAIATRISARLNPLFVCVPMRIGGPLKIRLPELDEGYSWYVTAIESSV